MKYIIFLFALCLASIDVHAQIVTFEDDNFKSYLISLGIDTNGDGEIQNAEAETVTDLHIESTIIESVVGIQAFTNLVSFSSKDLTISFIDLSNLSSLESIRIDAEFVFTSLIAQNCTSLVTLDKYQDRFELESVDLTGCTAIEDLEFDYDHFTNLLILNDCTSLKTLAQSSGNGELQNLELSNCNSLTTLNLMSNVDILDVSGLTSLESIDIFGELNQFICDDMPSLTNITTFGGILESLSISNCPVMTTLEIESYGNIVGLELNDFPELLSCSLDFQGDFFVFEDVLITNCPKLVDLELNINNVRTLDLSNCTSLESIIEFKHLYLSNLILKNCISIIELDLSDFNALYETLDLSGMTSLTNIRLFDGPEKVILDGCSSLLSYNINRWNITKFLDFSSCASLNEVNLGLAGNIETLILKNGTNETVQFQGPSSLANVCLDQSDVPSFQTLIDSLGLTDVNISTNCIYTNPGLPFNITGKSILDINNDNCATSSQTLPFTKYSITNALGGEGYFFANNEGDYNFNLPEGDYTYKPEVLYGNDLFTITPIERAVSFPTDGATVNQDFCFTAGIPIDIIEVTLIPLGTARPGFDARYLITYTNTGNVTRGGDIKLNYQDDRMDFLESTPMADVQEEGFLSWAFEDLIPYETRSIEFSMNLNSPMDTPPLNGGDILEYNAEVGPLGNQTVTAYWSNLNQETVNSFDPNDKTCLDGDILDPSMIGDFVKYMIRFENTGSAEAVNIVVTDSIDGTKFDIRTLEILNASHQVETSIEGNVIDFIFKDIYLPFEDATNDGYVTFKIKTNDDLVLGDDLRNKAEIYFDFNFPIITNTTSTVVTDLSSIFEEEDIDIHVVVSPNPFIDVIDLSSSEAITRIEIFSVSGKMLEATSFTNRQTTKRLDLADLNSGIYFLKVYNQDKYSLSKIIRQ